MRRVVLLFPSGLTLGNLFFGVFAIIAASRLEFVAAGVYVLLGGICDAFDGRVARATNAGTQFGEELDSLVDAITFGLAPGMIMYFAVLNRTGWDWVWVFLFTAAAVLRLARFNIEQAGIAKTYFQGLPSPAAGITLASYYWFSQSSLYTYGAIADLKWHVLLRYLMVVLSFLMISNVPYPVFPRTGFRSLRTIAASMLVVGSFVLLATRKLEYFFPFALLYVAWGLARWVFSGLFERRQPTMPYDLSEGEDDDEEADDEDFELSESQVHVSRQGHRDGKEEERPERPERPERLARAERTRPRQERPARQPAPAERQTERSAERPPRAPDAERPARRDKKKERPTREERPARPDRPERIVAPMAAPTAPAITGVDAITRGEPEPPDTRAIGEELATVESAVVGGTPGSEGTSAPRKRKRRRRRGERKDRPAPGEPQDTDDADLTSDAGAGDDGDPYAPDGDERSSSALVPPPLPPAAPSTVPTEPRQPPPSSEPSE